MSHSNDLTTSSTPNRRHRRARAAEARKTRGGRPAKGAPAPTAVAQAMARMEGIRAGSAAVVEALRPRLAALRPDQAAPPSMGLTDAAMAAFGLIERARDPGLAEALEALEGSPLWSAERLVDLQTSASALVWFDAVFKGSTRRGPTVEPELIERLKDIVGRLSRIAFYWFEGVPEVLEALDGLGSSPSYAALAHDAIRLHDTLAPRIAVFAQDTKNHREGDLEDAVVLADRVVKALALHSPETRAALRAERARAWTVFRRDFRLVRQVIASLVFALELPLELPTLRAHARPAKRRPKPVTKDEPALEFEPDPEPEGAAKAGTTAKAKAASGGHGAETKAKAASGGAEAKGPDGAAPPSGG